MNIKEKLQKINQEQLLKFEKELTNTEKQDLYNQINEIDFSYLDELNKTPDVKDDVITPIKAMTTDEIE